ncbi:MAG: methyltransferase domain-containing protein [Aeromicrobium sp.]|uniref:class I SAM-dependent methyltransferase n=1 Tax=Aeromicrobium sp. TaxID=1871063 RepID=UPI0039E29E7F
MTDPTDERVADWLVGRTDARVLHLGDGPLAYTLADRGHEVVVVGEDAQVARRDDLLYVRAAGERLPFVSSSFDVVLAPTLDDSNTALGEYARVLRTGGLLSSVYRAHDETVPWMRKLRALLGPTGAVRDTSPALVASGLFETPETERFAVWDELDLDGLLRFAREQSARGLTLTLDSQVRRLFAEYAIGAATLRLRREVRAIRALVDKSALPIDDPPDGTVLFEFH